MSTPSRGGPTTICQQRPTTRSAATVVAGRARFGKHHELVRFVACWRASLLQAEKTVTETTEMTRLVPEHQCGLELILEAIERKNGIDVTPYNVALLNLAVSSTDPQACIVLFATRLRLPGLLSVKLADQLKLECIPEQLTIRWTAGHQREERQSRRLNLSVSGVEEADGSLELHAVRTVEKLMLPRQKVDFDELAGKYNHLRNLPIASYDGQPRLLIGLNNIHTFQAAEVKAGADREPVAVLCKLGWSVYGLTDSATHQVSSADMDEAQLILGKPKKTKKATRKPKQTGNRADVNEEQSLEISEESRCCRVISLVKSGFSTQTPDVTGRGVATRRATSTTGTSSQSPGRVNCHSPNRADATKEENEAKSKLKELSARRVVKEETNSCEWLKERASVMVATLLCLAAVTSVHSQDGGGGAANSRNNLLLRRGNIGRQNPLAKTTTTTPPPEYAEDEYVDEEGEQPEGDEAGEEAPAAGRGPLVTTTTTTTEAPKKNLRPSIRPFRSNDDLLSALKKRRLDAKNNKPGKRDGYQNNVKKLNLVNKKLI
ncbi:hypothetical protein CpipJ_CPIJ015249 [Culex quinquefasciatus]|uniref:Uncharacterized protein n=1 Tax=Culex quinquefasciatus TaxID=7176 RepID=B0X8T1_CULQU|nr:hypothetical protein CpipJ_CPIJ015249 [Culex quinquefasciatus]|eukprot:XP_001866053.1 hypothetical protein CpipJ_CPIJ015249 [Culex quinquefasciatus]